MKALLFAAGLGTRLRPLTNDRPKALVEVNGVTLLEVAIRRLVAAGCRELIVNVHHFAEQVIDFIEKKGQFGIRIVLSDEREQLLDTGGGLKKAAWFFDDGQPFLVCNADVLTDMNLARFYQKHLESGALATLAVRQRITSRYLLFDEKMRLSGWKNAKTGENKLAVRQLAVGSQTPIYPIPQTSYLQYAFSGIHAISPGLFNWLPEGEGAFSIIDVYLNAASSGQVIGYDHSADAWLDVGKPESLGPAAEFLKKNRNFAG
ncbi:MAG: nucleotidyltransferase family protein [Saprospiraceae bacterium]|nr:nucleotidyltransferase family protein [Saprospiraceae bacterium]MCF8249091.1 nucleotidyltransferase family protein [Saprospiraceae bacterium]MCF8280958.1 nucleotidyltransferase family protein [Bacteroidales bacterium]MCF8311113.1 nucleotidyltransferase family protein [Saprospiraceae bacterium]MCF8440203.1 nucleotidyltransferase family protein [Saprospiraceae bacterium]